MAFVHDMFMAALSFCLALALRLGENVWYWVNERVVLALLAFTAICAVVFLFMGLYRGIWRYASLNDVLTIFKAATLAMLLFLAVDFLLTRLDLIPRSWLLINWFVLIFLLSAPRMAYRVYKDHSVRHLLERAAPGRVPVVLIGVDDAAEVFVREMGRDPAAPYEVQALIDPKGGRTGRELRGIPVLGKLEDLPDVLDRLSQRDRPPQRLILTRRLQREDMERLLDLADSRGMTIARLPRIAELQSGETAAGEGIQVRPIAIEDLLGRTQAKLDRGIMRQLIEGRRILVTGAGGSIGAELARQIAAFRPTEIALLDNSEYNLYAIDLELREQHAQVPRRTLLADVRDRPRIERAVRELDPHLVFHAAALKHVPMVEANPVEGVLTNVLGTRNVADACLRAGVTAMVLVSTDKAINPMNVMGATKRLAESYCQALDLAEHKRFRSAGGTATRFVTLRFGNVLGSTGSVVPLFQRQLAAGGPLTVTHPEVKRYFMTIREAVELVLEGAAHSIEKAVDDAGKIYVLDMGEPIKIDDLARQVVRLAGLRPDKDVEIAYTGLRPGEKLNEELFHDNEPMLQTPHPGLLLATPRTSNLELLRRGLDELGERAAGRDREQVLATLRRLVPEYRETFKGQAAGFGTA